MLGPFYYSIYSSGITVEYLTQISSEVPKHLQLLNLRPNLYIDSVVGGS